MIPLLVVALSSFNAFAEDALKPGFHDVSEVGIVVTTGNSKAQTYNLKTSNTYGWDENGVKLEASFLKTSTSGVETARFWSLGVRYERAFSPRYGVYAGELLESNVFSGFLQRYGTDVGAKFIIMKEDDLSWIAEAGYRYTAENRFTGQTTYSMGRLYTEAVPNVRKDVQLKLWLEYLPNFTFSDDYQFNGEASIAATLTEIFSVKTGYLVKFRNTPPAAVSERTDSWFTAALVAKF